jgi:serine/threonine protein kinase
MLKALHYCQKVIGIVHRDIKPDNIMISRKREAVLIDFGVSTKYDLDAVKENEKANDLLKLRTGTYMFFAPELFKTGKDRVSCGPATDMWALGITFYYLLTGKFPY